VDGRRVFRARPPSRRDAHDRVGRTGGSRFLGPFRGRGGGRPPSDRRSLAGVLVALSRAAEADERNRLGRSSTHHLGRRRSGRLDSLVELAAGKGGIVTERRRRRLRALTRCSSPNGILVAGARGIRASTGCVASTTCWPGGYPFSDVRAGGGNRPFSAARPSATSTNYPTAWSPRLLFHAAKRRSRPSAVLLRHGRPVRLRRLELSVPESAMTGIWLKLSSWRRADNSSAFCPSRMGLVSLDLGAALASISPACSPAGVPIGVCRSQECPDLPLYQLRPPSGIVSAGH